jgi:hypothetical protein
MRYVGKDRFPRSVARTAVRLAAAAAVIAAASSSASAYTIWQGGHGFWPVSSSVVRALPVPGSATRFQATSPGTYYIDMNLAVPSDVKIDSLTICYELSDPSSYITQTRVVRMDTPVSAVIWNDDPTDRTASSDCYTVTFFPITVDRLVSLALQLVFASTSHYIEIGAVGIHVSPSTTSVDGGSWEGASPERRAALGQNRPNPFNPETTIDFRVREAGQVALEIFDAQGRRVRTLVDERRPAGEYQARWDGRADDGSAVASGTYFYRLAVEGDAEVRKMVVLK